MGVIKSIYYYRGSKNFSRQPANACYIRSHPAYFKFLQWPHHSNTNIAILQNPHFFGIRSSEHQIIRISSAEEIINRVSTRITDSEPGGRGSSNALRISSSNIKIAIRIKT